MLALPSAPGVALAFAWTRVRRRGVAMPPAARGPGKPRSLRGRGEPHLCVRKSRLEASAFIEILVIFCTAACLQPCGIQLMGNIDGHRDARTQQRGRARPSAGPRDSRASRPHEHVEAERERRPAPTRPVKLTTRQLNSPLLCYLTTIPTS